MSANSNSTDTSKEALGSSGDVRIAMHDELEGPVSRKPPIKAAVNRRRVVMRWVKRGFFALVVVAVIGLIVKASIPKPIAVDMVDVKLAPMKVTVDEDGRARVKDRHVVSAPLNGSLGRIELSPGDDVKQGQVVARIVPLTPPLMDKRSRTAAEARVAAALASKSQASAQIERARAALKFAKAQAKRDQKLADDGVLPRLQLERSLLNARTAKADLDSLQFGARVANYEVEMARAALGHMSTKKKGREDQLEVPAPVDGRVLKVMQKSEGVVQLGAPLIEVGDPTALEIVVDVLTSDAVLIKRGATVTVDRWGGAALDARVRLVEPSAFTRLSALGVEEQRVNVVIDLVAKRDQWKTLGDGYRIEAHIVVWQSDKVVQVPASAVFRHGEGWAVYRVDSKLAKLQPVTIGQRNGREVQIKEGLDPSAKVIAHPSDSIKDGVEVIQR